MWLVAIPIVIVFGVVPIVLHHRKQHLAEPAYTPVPVDDIEVAQRDTPSLETTVCDVVEWLNDARDRLNIVDGPVIERVETGGSISATRISFQLKNGWREIWLEGPVFMEPLPRIRDVDWKVSDIGITFLRSAEGVEKAVLESNARRIQPR